MAGSDPISLALLALAALGALITLVAYRGRLIRVGPTCRRCTFDLTGLAAAGHPPARCPECGSDLSAPRAVRSTLRRRRPLLVAFGALLALLGAGGLVLIQSRALKPNAVAAASSESVLLWIDRLGNAPWHDAARNELVTRAYAGSLSPGTLKSLAATALRTQADPAALWDPRLGSLFECAFDAGLVSNADAATFLRQAIELKIFPERGVRPGLARWQLLISPTRAGSWVSRPGPPGPTGSTRLRTIPIAVHLDSVTLMGKPVPLLDPDPGRPANNLFVLGLQQGRTLGHTDRVHCPPQDASGELVVTYSLRFDETLWDLPALKGMPRHILNAVSSSQNGPLPHPDPDLISTPAWTQTLAAPIQTVAASPDIIDVVETPEAAEKMRSAFRLEARRVVSGSAASPQLFIAWDGQSVPALGYVKISAGAIGGTLSHVDQFMVQRLPPPVQRNERGWMPFDLPANFADSQIEVIVKSAEPPDYELLPNLAGAADRNERLAIWRGTLSFTVPIKTMNPDEAARRP